MFEYKTIALTAYLMASGVNPNYVQNMPSVQQFITADYGINVLDFTSKDAVLPSLDGVPYLVRPVGFVGRVSYSIPMHSQVQGPSRAQNDIFSSNINTRSKSTFTKKSRYPRIKKDPKPSLVQKVHGHRHMRDENVMRNIVEAKRGLNF